ncbi:MAG: NAD(P)-dependent oxidoreductase [Gammaproteobacteria bacterium]|nr:NAD(P)-dependent oxidoreductase [Gammaproteobacteria bacterium]
MQLVNHRILVTGPAGQIAFPLARRLAENNEVWGIARFSDAATRKRVDAVGVVTRSVDLADPDWADLPDSFDYVLHLAARVSADHDYDRAIQVNAEATGQLMSRFRSTRACLVMSTCRVYAVPEHPRHNIVETDPLAALPQPYSATYAVSKLAQEAVARFAAREFNVPTVIARMNVAYGDNGGLPAMLLEAILQEAPIQLSDGANTVCLPIHESDIFDHLPGLLAAASVPAVITNWGGDQLVDIRELVAFMAEQVGREAHFESSPEGIVQLRPDPAKRARITGPCKVDWRDGIRRMIAARHPGIDLSCPRRKPISII